MAQSAGFPPRLRGTGGGAATSTVPDDVAELAETSRTGTAALASGTVRAAADGAACRCEHSHGSVVVIEVEPVVRAHGESVVACGVKCSVYDLSSLRRRDSYHRFQPRGLLFFGDRSPSIAHRYAELTAVTRTAECRDPNN